MLLPRLISTGEYSVDSFRGEKKRRQKQKPRRSWQFRYNQLIAFKEEVRHSCDLSLQLHCFCNSNSASFMLLLVLLLLLLAPPNPNPNPNLMLLVQTSCQNGHCLVPIRGTVLGRWVRDQRIQYKSFVRGEKFKGSLTEDKVDLLNAVGFSWRVTAMCLAKQRWMERYNELKAFKMENGHTNVPRNHPLGFGYWVYNQRRLRRRNELSDDHKDLLDKIGFNWGKPQTACTDRHIELDAGYKYMRVNGRLVPNGKDTVYYDVETAKPQPVSVYRYQLFKPRECTDHVGDVQSEKKGAEADVKSETHGERKRQPTPAPTCSTITVPSKRKGVVYSNVEYAEPIRQQVQNKQESINDGAIAIMSKRKGSVYSNVEYAQPIRQRVMCVMFREGSQMKTV